VEPIYLDNAATTRVDFAVRAAMAAPLDEGFGNPSSRHPLGLAAARALEGARATVARAVGARPQGVVFTSGGTEANNLAVLGLARARARAGRHVLVGPTEHPSVRDPAAALADEGFEVETLHLDAHGMLDLEDLAAHLRKDTALVLQMLVNNEVGTIYPLARVARLVGAKAPGALLHVDAVQALGKLEVSLAELGAHSLAISAHKIHGPKGAGALVLAEGVRPRPLLHGGGQQQDLRPGTENVAGILGLACAAELATERLAETARSAAELRALLERELARVGGIEVLRPGGSEHCTDAIVALLLPGPPAPAAEVWMHHLEERGVFVSAGSACHAKKGGVSGTLAALGFDEQRARRVLRVSFARTTSPADVRAACDALAAVAGKLAPR
jgi:cysteine desulfurase